MAKPMTKRLKELVRQLCLILGGIFESAIGERVMSDLICAASFSGESQLRARRESEHAHETSTNQETHGQEY